MSALDGDLFEALEALCLIRDPVGLEGTSATDAGSGTAAAVAGVMPNCY